VIIVLAHGREVNRPQSGFPIHSSASVRGEPKKKRGRHIKLRKDGSACRKFHHIMKMIFYAFMAHDSVFNRETSCLGKEFSYVKRA
jgi:hypothetical protein